jgi:hypothetical protein
VHLFGEDHLAREFLERDRLALDESEELAIELERRVLGLHRLAEHLADVGRVRVEQRTDRERGIRAQRRDPLANGLCVRERLGALGAQPRDDRDAAVAEHEERVMRVAHDAGELALEQTVQHADNLVLVDFRHVYSPSGNFAGSGDSVGRF